MKEEFEKRMEWEGEVKGHLVILSEERLTFNDPRALIDYLILTHFSDDPTAFKPEELQLLGAVALFLAICKIAPYKRKDVLDRAVHLTGGSMERMSNEYSWWLIPESLSSFKEGLRALASHLKPIRTDAQAILRSVAFDFIQEKFERYRCQE